MRASAVFERDAGNTPTGRLAARTGAATVAGPVLRVRYGSVPVSANASGSVPPARAIARAIDEAAERARREQHHLRPRQPAGQAHGRRPRALVAGSGTITTSAPSTASREVRRRAVEPRRSLPPLGHERDRPPRAPRARSSSRAPPQPHAVAGEREIGGGRVARRCCLPGRRRSRDDPLRGGAPRCARRRILQQLA